MCLAQRRRASGVNGTRRGRNGATRRRRSSSKSIWSSCRPAWIGRVSSSTRSKKFWTRPEKSVNSRLTVSETVELLNQLKATVRDCAAAEERATRELRNKTELAEKRLRQEVAACEKDFSEKLAQAEAEFQATREKFRARHKYWTGRISKARHSSERLAFKRIDDAEGKRKHPLQKALLDTRRRREEELKGNEARFADVCAQAGNTDFCELRIGESHAECCGRESAGTEGIRSAEDRDGDDGEGRAVGPGMAQHHRSGGGCAGGSAETGRAEVLAIVGEDGPVL